MKDPPKPTAKRQRESLAAELRRLGEKAAASTTLRLSLREIHQLLGRE